MENQYYSMHQVCEILGEKIHNIRYLEKALCLNIARDEFLQRQFTSEDIDLIRKVKELKKQNNLSYDDIKNELQLSPCYKKDTERKFSHPIDNKETEVCATLIKTDKDDRLTENSTIDTNSLCEMIKNLLCESLDPKIDTLTLKLETLEESISQLKSLESTISKNKDILMDQTTSVKKSLERDLERHFREFDERLFRLRTKRVDKNKNWLKKFFCL